MKSKVIAYWITTILLALELLVGGITDLVHGKGVLFAGAPVVDIITRLSYPVYLLTDHRRMEAVGNGVNTCAKISSS